MRLANGYCSKLQRIYLENISFTAPLRIRLRILAPTLPHINQQPMFVARQWFLPIYFVNTNILEFHNRENLAFDSLGEDSLSTFTWPQYLIHQQSYSNTRSSSRENDSNLNLSTAESGVELEQMVPILPANKGSQSPPFVRQHIVGVSGYLF